MSDKPTVFICYSPEDEEWRQRVTTQLRACAQGRFDVWDEHLVDAGANRVDTINHAIDAAHIAVLLISADFLASSEAQTQVQHLLARRERDALRIAPVVVQPCPWDLVPWLSSMQVRPERRRALAIFQATEQEEWLAEFARELWHWLQTADHPTARRAAAVPIVAPAPRGPTTFPLPRHEPSPTPTLVLGGGASSSTIWQGLSLGAVVDFASRVTADKLDQIRDQANEGEYEEALEQLRRLRADATGWSLLLPEQQARFLRLEAAILFPGDVPHDELTALLDRADAIFPPKSRTVRAQLVEAEHGAEAALASIAAPRTPEERTTAARLLVVLGRPHEALAELAGCDAELESDADVHRWRAFAHLALREHAAARVAVEKAMALKPRHLTVIFCAGVVDYLSALTPVATPARFITWPPPVPHEWVRRDGQSMTRLARARERFHELLRRRAGSPKDVELATAWILACLANDLEREEQAADYCRELLASNPCNSMALGWALARDWAVDYGASAKALEQVTSTGGVTTDAVLALAGLRLRSRRSQKYDEALRLLDEHRELFDREREGELWRVWRTQVLVHAGRFREAAALAEGGSDPSSKQNRWLVRLAEAQASRDFRDYLRAAEVAWRNDGDADPLLRGCMAVAGQKRVKPSHGKLLAPYRDFLASTVGTADAVHLAAATSWEIGEFAACLRTLDQHRTAFPNEQLPPPLREARLACCHKLGLVSEALSEAEALAHEQPTFRNRFRLLHVNLSIGDVRAAARTASDLLGAPELKAREALFLAQELWPVDRPLARDFWRRGCELGWSDDESLAAWHLGLTLRMREHELRPLFVRVQGLAASGKTEAIRAASLEELLTHLDQARTRDEQFDRDYLNGTVPLHGIADVRGFELAWPYHALLQQRENSANPQGALLTRWGGYPALDDVPEEVKRMPLIADVSGLLLGEHLGILDAVERTLGPIQLSPDLPEALRHMERDLGWEQSERLDALRDVVRLATAGALRVETAAHVARWDAISDALAEDMGERWVRLLTRVRASRGVLVDFMPLRRLDLKEAPRDVPAEVQAHVVSGGDIAVALLNLGVLSAKRLAIAQQFLGPPARPVQLPPLAQRSHVFLDLGLGTVLAQAGILEPACRAFDIVLDEQEHRNIQAELEATRARRELAEWVAGVTRRVADGLRDGRYHLNTALNNKTLRGRKVPGWATKVFLGTLTAQVEPPALVWIEDRCISAQAAKWKRSIIGSYEILYLLRQRKAIDDQAYFEALLRLRRARVYFIPADAEELVYWLDQAAIHGEFTETEELSAIRRYFAAAFNAEIFIVPDGTGETLGEAPFAISVLHATRAALQKLWCSQRPRHAKATLSSWLWESLSRHEVGRLPLGAQAPVAGMLGVQLAALSVLDPPEGTDLSAPDSRVDYAAWLDRRLLVDRFAVDPGLRTEAAGHLRRWVLHGAPPEGATPKKLAVWRAIMNRYAGSLPTLLREELQADTELMAKLGHVMQLGVNIGPLRFPHPDVWPAFARAIDEGHAEAVTTDARVVRVEATREAAGAWTLTLHVDETQLPSTDPLHGLLSSAIQEREATLRLPRCRRFFDCSNADFEKALAEIVTLGDPGDRIMAGRRWIEDSTASRYDALGQALESRSDLAHEAVAPPPIGCLLGAWRLPRQASDAPFAEQIEIAARTLLEDVGLGETLTRLGALPVPLAPPAVQAIADLAPAEREALLLGYSNSCRSSLARLHAVRLLLQFADGSGLRDAAQAHLAWFVEHGRDACASILSLAQAALDQFQKQSGFGEFSVAQRLTAAWIHAHEVDSRLRLAGAPDEWIRGVGKWALRGTPEDWLRPESALVNDIAWPRQLTPEALLVFGLAHALSAEPARGREILPPLRAPLVERLTWVSESGLRLPIAEIVLTIALARDSVGSFLAWRPEVADVLGEEIGAQVTPEFLDGALHWIVQDLENRPDDVARWLQLVIRLAMLPPPAALTDRIEALVERLDPRQLMAEPGDAGRAIETLLFVCLQKSLGQLRVHDATARALLIGAARRLCDIPAPQLGDLCKTETTLLEACRAGAIVAGDPEASARRLAELLRAVVDAWPALGKACRVYVQTLADRLPVAQGKWLWTLLTYLRSLP